MFNSTNRRSTRFRLTIRASIGLIVALAAVASAPPSALAPVALGIDFRQAANDGPPLGDIAWINSILQQNNSYYVEGMSVPQRLVLVEVPATTGNDHRLTFSHQATKGGGIHAYDFLTSWQQAITAAKGEGPAGEDVLFSLADPDVICGPALGPEVTQGICDSLWDPTQNPVIALGDLPDNMGSIGMGTMDVAQQVSDYEASLGNRQITLRAPNGNPVSNVVVNFLGYTVGNDNYAEYELLWTSATTTIAIEFAGHLSVGDPDGIVSGYGTGWGASAISGGPYHFKLAQLDGALLGSQDNQIKGADIIIPPPPCDIDGPQLVCQGDTGLVYTDISGNDATFVWSVWSLVGANAGTTITSGQGTGSIMVTVGASEDGFTVQLSKMNAGGTTVCDLPVSTPPLHDSVKGWVFLGTSQPNNEMLLPMRNVTVSLDGSGLSPRTTDSQGHYVFNNVPPGSYRVTASVSYLEPGTQTDTDADADDTTTVVNYPNWLPDETVKVGAGAAVTVDKIVFPWPIVMQAGLYGSAKGTWAVMRDFLDEDAVSSTEFGQMKHTWHLPAFLCFPMPCDHEFFNLVPCADPPEIGAGWGYDNDASARKDHTDNAERLRLWFAARVLPILSQWITPADQFKVEVFLVGHSMGGIIGRVHESAGHWPHVARLASLDGVHGGTAWAYGLFDALQEVELNGLLKQQWSGGPPPSAGDYVEGKSPWNADFDLSADETPRVLFACEDGIVLPDESAFGIGRTYYDPSWLGPPEPTQWAPDWVSGADCMVLDTGHTQIHSAASVLRHAAQFFAYGFPPPALIVPGQIYGQQEQGDSSEEQDGRTLQEQGSAAVLTGTLAVAPASSSQVVVMLDDNALVTGRFLRLGAEAAYELSDAGGRISLLPLGSEDIAAGAVFDVFEFGPVDAGPVTITLNSGPGGPAALDFSFECSNGRTLLVVLDDTGIDAGMSVPIQAGVVDVAGNVLTPTGTAAMTAYVRLPDETVVEMPLADDGQSNDGMAGDGLFGGSFAGTAQEGRYLVECQGSIPVGSETVERTGEAVFSVWPTGAMLVGPSAVSTPDIDGDVLYDALVFDHDVSVSKSGNYKLLATLMDGAGVVVSQPSHAFEFTDEAGSYTAALVVAGADLVRHGVDGPWVLADIRLIALDADALPASSLADQLTPAIPASAFEPPKPPNVQTLMPSSGPVAGGNEVVLMGTGLSDVTSVKVGGVSAPFVLQDDLSVRITMPAVAAVQFSAKPLGPGPGASQPVRGKSAPTVDIVVRTPWGKDTVEKAYQYK